MSFNNKKIFKQFKTFLIFSYAYENEYSKDLWFMSCADCWVAVLRIWSIFRITIRLLKRIRSVLISGGLYFTFHIPHPRKFLTKLCCQMMGEGVTVKTKTSVLASYSCYFCLLLMKIVMTYGTRLKNNRITDETHSVFC